MAKISTNIRQFRNERKLTQDQLAEKINVSRQTVSSWETNRTQPDFDMLELLAPALDVGIEELIYGRKNRVGLEPEKKNSRSVTVIVLSLLGTLLTAAGLIIIFVSFWEELQFAKNILALLPLAAGFGLAFFARTKKPDSVSWREGTAVAWTVGFAATNALINSLNAVDMGFAPLLLLDALLALPVFLITNGVFPLVGYFYAITHACMLLMNDSGKTGTVIFALLFTALYIIGIILLKKRKTGDVRDLIFLWAAVLAGCVGSVWGSAVLSETFGHYTDSVVVVTLACVLITVTAVGHKLPRRSVTPVFTVLCSVCTSVLVIANVPLTECGGNRFPDVVIVCIFALLAAAGVVFGFKELKKDIFRLTVIGASALQTVFAATLPGEEERIFITLIPALVIAVCYIVHGIKLAKLAPANFGMVDAFVILYALLLFSETDVIFTGIAIAAAGIILLIVNRVLLKRFSSEKEGNDHA